MVAVRFTEANRGPKYIIHADDYGITLEQSRRILACSSMCGGMGALNSLSVLVTSPEFCDCATVLMPFADRLLIGLHVNLVEGPCAADPIEIPLLVNGDGVFRQSFGGMLALSTAHPKELRRQLQIEIGAQLNLFLDAFPEMRGRLRVDSHQHFHMIPAVFDALATVVEESGCALEYMRIPAEPVAPFAAAHVKSNVPFINAVKRVTLNTLWRRNWGKVEGLENHSAVFCGIGFSGCMNEKNVASVLPAFMEYADDREQRLEFLFHPGGVKDSSACLNPDLPGFVSFYSSANRDEEANALKWLQGCQMV